VTFDRTCRPPAIRGAAVERVAEPVAVEMGQQLGSARDLWSLRIISLTPS